MIKSKESLLDQILVIENPKYLEGFFKTHRNFLKNSK